MELERCLHCGNTDPDITTIQPLAMRFNDDDTVRCGADGCPIKDVTMTIAAWNRRYVCPDKNDKAVFAGDDVKLAIIRRQFITCRIVEQRPPRYGYGLVGDNDYWNDFIVSEDIELIESEVADG